MGVRWVVGQVPWDPRKQRQVVHEVGCLSPTLEEGWAQLDVFVWGVRALCTQAVPIPEEGRTRQDDKSRAEAGNMRCFLSLFEKPCGPRTWLHIFNARLRCTHRDVPHAS